MQTEGKLVKNLYSEIVYKVFFTFVFVSINR